MSSHDLRQRRATVSNRYINTIKKEIEIPENTVGIMKAFNQSLQEHNRWRNDLLSNSTISKFNTLTREMKKSIEALKASRDKFREKLQELTELKRIVVNETTSRRVLNQSYQFLLAENRSMEAEIKELKRTCEEERADINEIRHNMRLKLRKEIKEEEFRQEELLREIQQKLEKSDDGMTVEDMDSESELFVKERSETEEEYAVLKEDRELNMLLRNDAYEKCVKSLALYDELSSLQMRNSEHIWDDDSIEILKEYIKDHEILEEQKKTINKLVDDWTEAEAGQALTEDDPYKKICAARQLVRMENQRS